MDGTFKGRYLVIIDRSFLSIIHTNAPYGYSSVRCFYSNKYPQVTDSYEYPQDTDSYEYPQATDSYEYPQVTDSYEETCTIEPRHEKKPMFWFLTWSDTNRTVQPQKMARGLKIWI